MERRRSEVGRTDSIGGTNVVDSDVLLLSTQRRRSELGRTDSVTGASIVVDSDVLPSTQRRRSEFGRADSGAGSTNVADWEVVPITQRGLFQRDDFFQAHRDSFDAAVQRFLQRFSDDATSGSAAAIAADTSIPLLRRYRSIKTTQLNKDDIQVVTQLQDDQHHKIVLDVRDYMNGELSVKVSGGDGGDIVVHGVVIDDVQSTSSGGEQKRRTLTKQFSLPSDTCADDATSAISSDGVLTIITPKKAKPLDDLVQTEEKGNSNGTRTPIVRQRRRQRQPVAINNSMEGFPIVRRGNFFEDSIFEDAHEDFNEVIREILESTGETSTDDYLSYRKLRAKDLNEDNQAVTELEDGKQHKIIIDVKDFMTDGEVKVKALNDKDLIVEGQVEMVDNDEVLVKSFSRRFSLPDNAEIDAITSVVSSDGVLAVTTPKKVPPKKDNETLTPLTNEGIDIQPIVKRQESLKRKESLRSKELRRKESLKKNDPVAKLETLKKSEPLKRAESLRSPEPLRKIDPVKRSESLKKIEFLRRDDLGKPSNLVQEPERKEHIIPIKLENDTQISSKDEVDIPVHKESTSPKVDKDNDAKNDTSSNDSTKDNIGRRRNAGITPSLQNESSQSVTDKYLPIERLGIFFKDSFFEDAQSQYKVAVGDVLKKYGFTSNKNDISFYTMLRERSQNEDNQAAGTFYKDQKHKIIVDVKDFIGGDITIKIVGENELELEGKQEKNESNDIVTRNFKRLYIFPKSVEMSSITCSLSADGVIVIKAVKTSTDKSDNGNENIIKSILLTASNNFDKKDIVSLKETENDLKISVNEISETKEVKQLENIADKDVSVNKDTNENKDTCNIKGTSSTKDNSTSMGTSNDKGSSISKVTSTNKDNSTIKDSTTKKDNSKNKDSSIDKENTPKKDTPDIKTTEEGRVLQINKKGSFFSDSFFEEAAQRNLQTAIREVLNKTGISPIDDDFQFYRNLRQKSTNESTQAVNSTESDKSYKIVIDVQGFDENNVKVIIVSDKEIFVEGQQEIKDKSNTATRIFRRRFLLSNSVKTASVVSAVSSDGILTITAPKKVVAVNGMRGKKEVSSHVTVNSKNPKQMEAVHQVSSEATKKL